MITLSKSGGTVTFTFDGNSTYLQNGTIEVPLNSLSLIVDESGMATFRKSASNDIFVSALYSEFGMTKAELEEWYKENMVGSTGGGGGITSGEVQTLIDESISGKADTSALTVYFDDVEYDSSAKTINFYNGGVLKDSIDASDFVIDGMIDDVRIETISGASYLVIDFNTASGKEDIQIPLSDIFNPDNYYDKTAIDGIVSGLNEDIATKLDASAYTPTDLSEYWTSAQTESAINSATNDMATQTWVGQQGYLTEHQSLSAYSTTEEMNSAISEATSGKTNQSDFTAFTASTDTALGNKQDVSGMTAYTQNTAFTAHTSDAVAHTTQAEKDVWNAKSDFSGSYNDLTDKPTIPTVPTSNTAFTNDAQYATSGYVDSAVSGKANSSDVYTKSEVDNAITAATDDMATKTWVGNQNYLTEHQSLSAYSTTVEMNTAIDTATSGKVDTSAITSSVTSASTDSEIPTAKAVWEAASGGGKAIEAGRGISITTGETADTINGTLNLENGTNSTSGGLVLKSYAAGNSASGRDAIAFGGGNTANGTNSFVCGYYNTGNTDNAFVTGNKNITTNLYESLFGLWSLSNGNVTNDFTGDSGATMFAVGNGNWRERIRHNAFEVRENGDIYIADTNDTSTSNYYQKPMIKLQDALVGGSSYSAGTGIDISTANTISAVYGGWLGGWKSYLSDVSEPVYLFPELEECNEFTVNFCINDNENNEYCTTFVFTPSSMTYAYSDGYLDWSDYYSIEWSNTYSCFIATPNTRFVSLQSYSCAKLVLMIGSGSTSDALDDLYDAAYGSAVTNLGGGIDKTRFTIYAGNKIGNQVAYRVYNFEGGLYGKDNKITTNMQSSSNKWVDATKTNVCSVEFNSLTSAMTFDVTGSLTNISLSVNNTEAGIMKTLYSNNTWNTSDFNVTNENNHITVTLVNPQNYTFNVLRSGNCGLGNISNLKYWGYETDTIPNVVQGIRNDLGGLKLQQITQSAYDDLVSGGTVDNSTIYYIVN